MQKQAALVEAISLTSEILEVLEHQDFERVDDLETRRETLIHQAFSQSRDQIDIIKARHLQSLNSQVVEKLEKFRESILFQQSQIRKASKVSKAYQ